MEFDLTPTGSWPASAFAERSTPLGSLPPIFSPSPAVRCAKASFSMTATARPSGPAPTSMPAPAAKWRSLRRSTTIASNPRYTRSRDKPRRSAPCRACCGWRTTARYLPQSGNHHHDQRLAGGEAFRRAGGRPSNAAPPACSICSAATGVRRCWIWPGCAPICCRRSKTGTLLGAVTEAAAQQSGLRAGTPVVMGGGDVQLGCRALGGARRANRGTRRHFGSRWSTCRRCVPIRR